MDPAFPKAHGTIKAYIEEMAQRKEGGKSLKKVYQDKINRDNEAIFNFLDSDVESTITLVTTLKKALQAKALKADLDRFVNIKDIAVTYGIVIEKEITLRELQIKREKLEIDKIKLELEKDKLKAHINNPEAFAPRYTIVNDAPKHTPIIDAVVVDG